MRATSGGMMHISLWKRFAFAGCLTAFAAMAATAYADKGGNGSRVKLQDDCDPASFNAVLGDKACVGDGETTFQDFLAQVLDEGQADDWEFDPDHDHGKAGEFARSHNEGGETHTFTPVKKFGGGFVAVLNDGQKPIGECAALDDKGNPSPLNPDGTFDLAPTVFETFVGSGANGKPQKLTTGANRFQCCIHPWMRTTIQGR
jgi:hypothetical protein